VTPHNKALERQLFFFLAGAFTNFIIRHSLIDIQNSKDCSFR